MNIGAAARASGLPVKTIRYYEDIGLVAPDRADNGYRDFGTADIERLRFLSQARGLGFSLDECRRLVDLYADPDRASREVRTVATEHLEAVRTRISELRELEGTLQRLIARCPGNDSPDCSILDRLKGETK